MAILGNNIKTAFLKGMEAIGKGAVSLTNTAQQKLGQMNLENRRSELMKEIPLCAAKLHEDGAALPAELTALLDELSELNAQLAAMRPQPAAEPTADETPAEAPEAPQEDPIAEVVETAAQAVEAVVEDVREAVDGFFSEDKKDEQPEEASSETHDE